MSTNSRRAAPCLLVVYLQLYHLATVQAEFYVGNYKAVDQPNENKRLAILDKGVGAEGGNPEEQRSFSRRQLLLSTFNPFTPGGTVYLAFMLLLPVTVGTAVGRSNLGVMERILQQEGKNLYNEMGYINGNLIFKKALKHFLGMSNLKKKRRKRRVN